MTRRRLPGVLLPWLFLGALLAVLEAVVVLTSVPAYLLPRPSVVVRELVAQRSLIVGHLAVTMGEAIAGFLVGNAMAVLFGWAFSRSQVALRSVYPLVVGSQAVPVVAIAPFIVIWFGPGFTGKVVLAAAVCYFPAVVAATNGFRQVNGDALRLLHSFGATRSQVFWQLSVPSAIPGIVSALQVSSTLCVVGAVVAELSGSDRGVGYLVLRASYEFRTPMLFAVLTATGLASFGWFWLVRLVGERLTRRYAFSYAQAAD